MYNDTLEIKFENSEEILQQDLSVRIIADTMFLETMNLFCISK